MAILIDTQNILLEVLNTILLPLNSDQLSPFERKFRANQIIIFTNFVVVPSLGIKRFDCINEALSWRLLLSHTPEKDFTTINK